MQASITVLLYIRLALNSYTHYKKYKKIYCCTTRSFPANEHFFIRDTGLISSTIREVFHLESKCIMPLPYHDSDMPEHVIRTEYKNLTSVTWWKSLGIDALVLYSWGAPRYLPVARAVHKAGIRLIIHIPIIYRLRFLCKVPFYHFYLIF